MIDALLASYLLGIEQVQEDVISRTGAKAQSAEFAEGDDKRKRKPAKGGTPNDASRPPIDPRFDLPPKEAIEYFTKKKVVRKREFNLLSKEAQQSAFTVSGVYKEDVLLGFKDELRTALAEGATQQQTIKRFKNILETGKHEQLGEFHLETVFRTNMQISYGAARRRALEDIVDMFPVWQYYTAHDDRVRPRHAALEGITLRYDNAFWNSHFPPWDFNCRCGVTPTDEVPDGYDPKHPSGNDSVTLSYYEDGSPAKAEIGTQLIDLKVGKFSGVPRGGSMLSAIEAGVERAKESRSRH